MKKMALISIISAGGILLGACGIGSAAQQQQQSITNQLETVQPLPAVKYSQLRQTLIDIELAQTKNVATTSFMFNMGEPAPIQSCPSIGFPIASDTQLSNPMQIQGGGGNSNVAIPQMDPNGVYSGNSTGTYVLCANADGSTYVIYWEGFVETVSGPAVWNSATNSVKLFGPSTVNVSTGAPSTINK